MKGIGFETYRDLLECFVRLLRERLGDDLRAVVLYGSVARGTARPESDVDLLIVWREAPENYVARLKTIMEVAKALQDGPTARLREKGLPQPYLSYLVLSEDEADMNRYLYLDMVDEAILLHDPDGFFARRLRRLQERLVQLGARRVWLPDGSWYWDLKPDLELGEEFEL